MVREMFLRRILALSRAKSRKDDNKAAELAQEIRQMLPFVRLDISRRLVYHDLLEPMHKFSQGTQDANHIFRSAGQSSTHAIQRGNARGQDVNLSDLATKLFLYQFAAAGYTVQDHGLVRLDMYCRWLERHFDDLAVRLSQNGPMVVPAGAAALGGGEGQGPRSMVAETQHLATMIRGANAGASFMMYDLDRMGRDGGAGGHSLRTLAVDVCAQEPPAGLTPEEAIGRSMIEALARTGKFCVECVGGAEGGVQDATVKKTELPNTVDSIYLDCDTTIRMAKITASTTGSGAAADIVGQGEIIRIRKLQIAAMHMTINIRSPDMSDLGSTSDLRTLAFLVYLPLDMPNIDISVGMFSMYNKAGTKPSLAKDIGNSYLKELAFDAGGALALSYLGSAFKGVYSGGQWLVRGPKQQMAVADRRYQMQEANKANQLQAKEQEKMQKETGASAPTAAPAEQSAPKPPAASGKRSTMMCTACIFGCAEGVWRCMAEIIGNILIFILFFLTLLYKGILGASRKKAHSVLDGLSLGLRGLVIDTFITPTQRMLEYRRQMSHDYGTGAGIWATFLGKGLFS